MVNQKKRPERTVRGTLKQWTQRALFAMLVLTPVVSAAEESVSAPMKVDWDTAWELALERNESLDLARADVQMARYQVKEAYSSAMPTVEFNGTLNHYFKIPTQPVVLPPEFTGAPGPTTIDMQFTQENVVSANAQLTQPVWLAGKVGIALDVAREYEKIAKMQVKVSKADLKVQLMQSFYGCMIAERFLETAQDALDQAERYRTQVQQMHQEGVVSEYDLIRAGVAVSNVKPQVIQAEASRDLALKGLKILIGVDLEKPIEITGDLEMGLAPPEMPYENASQVALDNRLELRQLEVQKKLYGYQYKIEKRNWLWPNLLVGLRWDWSAQEPDLDLPSYRMINGVSGQMIVNIPLFDGFASSNRAQQAKVNMKKVDLQLKQAKRGIEVQVFQAMRDYQRASEELIAAEENVRQAEKGHTIAESRYAGGVGTQIEKLDAQLQLNQSKVMLLQAKYNKLVAKAQYDRAVGKDFTLETEE